MITIEVNINSCRFLLTHLVLFTSLTLSINVFADGVDSTDPFNFDLSSDSHLESSKQFSHEDKKIEKWDWSGTVSLRNQYRLPKSSWLSNRFRITLNNSYKHNQWTFFSRSILDVDPAITDYSDLTSIELREVYVSFDSALYEHNIQFTFGKQRLAWGTADGRSTIDRINAVDFSDPINNARTSSKRPSWLLSIEQSLPIGVLEVVWLPRGRDRKLAEYNSPWESTALNKLRTDAIDNGTSLTIADPHKSEGGLRLTQYGQGLDWGFAIFNGYTDAPSTLIVEQNNTRLIPNRMNTFNVNMAKGLPQSTLRGEISYTPNYPVFNGGEESLMQYIIGWDRTYFINFYMNIQLFLDEYSVSKDSYGMTYSLSDKFYYDAIEAGVRGQLSNQSQYSVETFMEYTIDDNYALDLRYIAFGGDDGSTLGDLSDNSYFEFEIRYSF